MRILFALMMVAATALGCAPSAGDSGSGGGGAQGIDDPVTEETGEDAAALVSIKRVPGLWMHPESAAWSPYHGRWLISNTLIGDERLKVFDGMGWLGHINRAGRALFPSTSGVLLDTSHWLSIDTSIYAQWGAGSDDDNLYGYLSNPVGLTTNPVTGNVYVLEAGWLDSSGKPNETPGVGAPAVVVFDKDGKYLHRIRQPTIVTINDVVWVQTPGAAAGEGKLYLTDSAFGGLAKVVQVTNPDSPAATSSTFVSLANYPRANAVALDTGHNSGGGVGPHLVISTLGDKPTGTEANGRVLTVDLRTGVVKGVTMTGPGAPAHLFSDTMAIAYTAGVFGSKVWLVGDLLSRKIYAISPTTGATTLYVDASGTIPQLGGGACAPRTDLNGSQCVFGAYGWQDVILTQALAQ